MKNRKGCSAVYLVFFLLIINAPLFPQEETAAEQSATANTSADGQTAAAQSETELPHLYTYIDAPVAEQRQVYTQDDIEKMHVQTVPELLEAAGIQMLSYGSYGMQSAPSLRGFTGGTVKVVIDGICVNSAQNGTVDYTALAINSIEKIEIVRGGFTEDVSGEGAVGGVVYITTKKQTLGNNFSADISGKTYFNPNAPLDTMSTGFGYSGQLAENVFLQTKASATAAANEYPYTSYAGKTAYRSNSSVTDCSQDTHLTKFFGNGNSWNVGDSTYGGYKHIAGVETSTIPGVQQDYNNRMTAGILLPAVHDDWKIDSTVAWNSTNQLYDSSAESSRHLMNTVTYTGNALYYGSSTIHGSIGTTLSAAFLNSTNDGMHGLFSGTVMETTKLFAGPVFSCSVPVAFSFSGSNCAVVPKLGMRADGSRMSFIIDGYRMCLFPDMNQLYWNNSSYASGNPDLKPEDGWGGEVTFSMHDVAVPFSVCAYTNYYFNKIQWQGTSGKWKPVNVASAFYAGCDVSASATLFSCVTIDARWEYLYNRLLAPGATYGKMIMYTPDNVGSLSVQYNGSAVSIFVEAQYRGKRYTDNSNLFFLKPYVLINASLSVYAGKYVTPYVQVDNMLNTSYEAVPDYPMPGISLEAGIRAKW